MSLSHITSIVTGGASGLGAATVLSIIEKGGRVIVADLPNQYRRYQEFIAMRNIKNIEEERIKFVQTDVTKEDQVKMALDEAEKTFGTSVNAAINCAGIAIAKRMLKRKRYESNGGNENRNEGSSIFETHILSDFTKSMNVNTVGTFNVARLAAERMVVNKDNKGGGGCIINTASIAAMDGQRGQVAYAASKAAIVGMTLPMARDLASYGIRVMTIAPGLFETPILEELPDAVKEELGTQVPFPSRLGHPNEFADLVCTILLNPMLNGEVIRLDGALRMPP